MKRYLSVPLVLTIILIACTPAEKAARDAIAGAQGVIVAAQTKYGPTCKALPTQTICVDINKAISFQNATITAVEAYCGWSNVSPPVNQSAKCVPVQSMLAGMNTAVLNLNQFITQLKGGL